MKNHGTIMSMMNAAMQYFDRAVWALHIAKDDRLPSTIKSHLTAMAVHACQSLTESLMQMLEGNKDDAELAAGIKELPHAKLIENVRNMDLHGCPIPICNPKVREVAMVAKPDRPITLSSSHGVAVSMRMDGLTPKVRRTPNDLKRGQVSIGGATVAYACDRGSLIVHDFSTGKDYLLLGLLESFLRRCSVLLKDRIPATDAIGRQDIEPGEANNQEKSDA